MNILPKKSWHVRTKKNIARVRRDEAKAAEEEKETQRRIALAAQESRTALLRERAGKRLAEATTSSKEVIPVANPNLGSDVETQNTDDANLRFGLPLASLRDVVQADGHVNFFQDVEAGKRQGASTNEEYEQEKQKEQDDYEKKIGYLVYLGQDSLEHSKNKPWYSNIDRGKSDTLRNEFEKEKELDKAAGILGGLEEKTKTISTEEIKMTKFKSFHDPLKDIRMYLSAPGMKRKLDSLPSSSTSARAQSPPRKKRTLEDTHKRHHKKEKHKKHKHTKKSKKHSTKKKKSKSKVQDSSDSDQSSSSEDSESERKRVNLEKLRTERLQREREERRKAEKVLAKLRGEEEPIPEPNKSHNYDKSRGNIPSTSIKQKYNSQFNPHLARQNYDYE